MEGAWTNDNSATAEKWLFVCVLCSLGFKMDEMILPRQFGVPLTSSAKLAHVLSAQWMQFVHMVPFNDVFGTGILIRRSCSGIQQHLL